MTKNTETVVTADQKRRDRAAETDRAARALIAAERAAVDKKTLRLREARLAKEAEESEDTAGVRVKRAK